MVKIKIASRNLIVLILFFNVFYGFSQKVNQFDANKKRTGLWKKHYKNNRIRYSGAFKNGKEVGVFKFYDDSNSQNPVITKEFNFKNDSVTVRFFTLKGTLKSKGKMIGRKREGKWFYYFSDGKTVAEEQYSNGKRNGISRTFYKNGKITEETFYKKGLRNGVYRQFSDVGILIEQVNYKKGILHGKAKYFELNGNVKESGEYANGKRSGKWEFYMDGESADPKEKKETTKRQH